MIKSMYEHYVLPPLLDWVCGLGMMQKQRSLLVPQAYGRVLEIGIGSGLNLPFYDKSRVTELCAVDPSAELTSKAQKRAATAGIDVNILQLGAEKIPAENDAFDCIVCTFTLCTIPDVEAALREMRRVLKPAGTFFFCEHGLAPDDGVARWQKRLNPYWKPCAGGCNLHRNSPELLRAAGFDIDNLDQMYLPGPKPWTYVSRGVAKLRAAP